MWLTAEEQEARFGETVRRRRLRTGMTVAEVAERAEVSQKTVANLEHGRGSTLNTLIKVLRALDAESWLDSLTPDEPISPIALLEQQRPEPRKRGRRSRD
ncbi:MAG: helix-turn-helix transcriptional regulator [Actinomycetota bacterium]